jgi:hypothetical protein
LSSSGVEEICVFLEIEHPEEKAVATFISRKKYLKGRLRLIFLGGTLRAVCSSSDCKINRNDC